MKTVLGILIGVATLAVTAGCMVVPAHPGYGGASASIYVAPTYASPGPGWAWEQHNTEGWGWRHPDHGWHRGWR